MLGANMYVQALKILVSVIFLISQQNKTEFTFHNVEQVHTDELVKVEVIIHNVCYPILLRGLPYVRF